MRFFDYFLFRMTKAYMRRDGREGRTAKISLSVLQNLLLLAVLLVCLKPAFPRSITSPYSKQIGWFGVILFGLLVWANYGRYDRKKYNELLLRWQQETPWHKRVGGLIMYASIPVVLIL